MNKGILQYLSGYFRDGCKPETEFRIGCEYEKFGFLNHDFAPLPYYGERSIFSILQKMQEYFNWQGEWEGDAIISMKKGNNSITLEPGGQIELSAEPVETIKKCQDSFNEHIGELNEITKDWGVTWFAGGVIPHMAVEKIKLIPKQRYQIMDTYLAKKGRLARHMMRLTQSIQISIDFFDECEAIKKFRVAMAISPLVAAIFANSPFLNGKPTGFHSFRQKIWQETDPERCGLIKRLFQQGDYSFVEYTNFASNVPMMFGKSTDASGNSKWYSMDGANFLEFLQSTDETLWLDLFKLHLTGIFTEVRLKTYIEIRSTDCVPEPYLHCIPALWKGIMYDNDALDEAWKLVSNLDISERLALKIELAKNSILAILKGRQIYPLCMELIKIARSGLKRQGRRRPLFSGEEKYLDPIEALLEDHLNPALLWLKEMENKEADPGSYFDFARFLTTNYPVTNYPG
ncbi:glutamate--cysteine ligase [Candidatus Riflebacteria bacterium]